MRDDENGRVADGWNWEEGWTPDFKRVSRQPFRVDTLEQIDFAAPLGLELMLQFDLSGINFGCGRYLKRNSLNVDTCRFSDGVTATDVAKLYRLDEKYFLQVDVTSALPIASGAAQWGYAEHLIEHLTLAEAISWLKEARRVTALGGIIRITTPDLRRYVSAYSVDSDEFFRVHRERVHSLGLPPMPDRRAFMINQIFEYWDHRWIYDLDEITYVLVQAGFDAGAVRECEFRHGCREVVAMMDSRERDDETMYVEVVV